MFASLLCCSWLSDANNYIMSGSFIHDKNRAVPDSEFCQSNQIWLLNTNIQLYFRSEFEALNAQRDIKCESDIHVIQ